MKPLRFVTRVRLAFLLGLLAVVAVAMAAVAWLIVEAHGGRLRLERRKGGGTAVVCWIPG